MMIAIINNAVFSPLSFIIIKKLARHGTNNVRVTILIITEKESGKYPVTIEISDGHGGKVLYNFDVTVRLK